MAEEKALLMVTPKSKDNNLTTIYAGKKPIFIRTKNQVPKLPQRVGAPSKLQDLTLGWHFWTFPKPGEPTALK